MMAKNLFLDIDKDLITDTTKRALLNDSKKTQALKNKEKNDTIREKPSIRKRK